MPLWKGEPQTGDGSGLGIAPSALTHFDDDFVHLWLHSVEHNAQALYTSPALLVRIVVCNLVPHKGRVSNAFHGQVLCARAADRTDTDKENVSSMRSQ